MEGNIKIIAILKRSYSDTEGKMCFWTETKSFDISEPIESILKWAKSRLCSKKCRNEDYTCYHLIMENITIAIDQNYQKERKDGI